MQNNRLSDSIPQALRPLMTRKVACGAAAALAVGIGLGVWLQPPMPHYGSQTVINPPQEQPNLWGQDASSVSTMPYDQPVTSPAVYQTASVSPEATAAIATTSGESARPMQLAQADPRQVAASGDTSHNAVDAAEDARPTQVTYSKPAALNVPPPQAQPQPQRQAQLQPDGPPRGQARDWATYDVRDRGARYGGQARDEDDDAPPPPRWDRPPERRWGPPPERRWDFRPDGSAVPLDDDGG